MVTAKDLKEYLKLPPDSFNVTGDAEIDFNVFAEAVKKSGIYTFIKENGDWLLNGSVVNLEEHGIVPGEDARIVVEYDTDNVEMYLNAAKSKAKTAGVPEFQNNAQYDLFMLSLAAMYYDNRGMTHQQSGTEQAAQNMINSFVLELRYGDEDG